MAKLIAGRVSSAKTPKTIVVTVTSRKTHPLYKKQYSLNTKYMAHDEKSEAKEGDKVVIRETRPLSARKRFTLAKITEKASAAFEEADAAADVQLPEPQKPEVSPVKKESKEEPKESKK